MFITDTDLAWETSKEWQDMAWQQACALTANIPVIVSGLGGEGSLPNLRDVDLALMGV